MAKLFILVSVLTALTQKEEEELSAETISLQYRELQPQVMETLWKDGVALFLES